MFPARTQLEERPGVSMACPENVRMSRLVGSRGVWRDTEGGEFVSTGGEVEYMLVTGPAPSRSAPPAPIRAE